MSTLSGGGTNEDLLRRICAEFAEMPGLRVTHQQAQRLWGLDAVTCLQALECLVDAGILVTTSSGQYKRQEEGPAAGSALRMAKAALDKRRDRGMAV